MKENYYSSSSVWRSYTTRGQVKGNKEGELVASSGAVKSGGYSQNGLTDNVTKSESSIKELGPHLLMWRTHKVGPETGIRHFLRNGCDL